MTGEYRFRVNSENLNYDFTIKGNITIIQGDSGTGKTTLIEYLELFQSDEFSSGITVISDAQWEVLTATRWDDGVHKHWHNKVVFADEYVKFLATEEFAQFVRDSGNYVVIVSRAPHKELYSPTYGVSDIYKIEHDSKQNSFVEVYHQNQFVPSVKPDVIIIEDKKLGSRFFQAIAEEIDTICFPSDGVESIKNILIRNNYFQGKRVLVIADSTVFGAQIKFYTNLMHVYPNVQLWFPDYSSTFPQIFWDKQEVQDLLTNCGYEQDTASSNSSKKKCDSYVLENKLKLIQGSTGKSLVASSALLGVDPDGKLSDKTLRLDEFRRSISPGANASRPKYQVTTPGGEVYFKFKMTTNEIGAELFAFHLAKALGVEVAETALAVYKNEVGIASLDIGDYEEPDDSDSYSIKNFLHLEGFVDMCLFDYLIMNEDRHAGNWGIRSGKVAPLFDHNNCFGGSEGFTDFDHFMVTVTSYFYVNEEYEQRHDMILQYLVEDQPCKVARFMERLVDVHDVYDADFATYAPKHHNFLNDLVRRRVAYMRQKVSEFCGR